MPGRVASMVHRETHRSLETREMLTVFVFDERESRREEDLPDALDRLDDDAMLWLALRDPTEEEVAAVQEALELSDEQAQRLLEQPSRASLMDAGEHMHVTLYVASSEDGKPVLRPVECVLGPNWVVTAHEAEIEVLEEFRERAEGGGQVGELDSPSFVAAAVEWVVTSYFRAFEAIERSSRSWTRRSCPTSRRTSPTIWRGWSSFAAPSGRCDARSPHTARSSSLWPIPSSICCRPRPRRSASPPSKGAWPRQWMLRGRRRSRPAAR